MTSRVQGIFQANSRRNFVFLFLTEEAYSHGGLRTREIGQTLEGILSLRNKLGIVKPYMWDLKTSQSFQKWRGLILVNDVISIILTPFLAFTRKSINKQVDFRCIHSFQVLSLKCKKS
jgi:hypothetical protein